MKILLVDDDIVDREIIKKALGGLNADFVECDTGAKCLAEIEKNPDLALILLDYILPDYDGIKIIYDIKQKTSSPIIMITGQGNEDLVRVTYTAGVLDYIPKNKITPEFLTRTILNDMLTHRAMMERQQIADQMQKNQAREIEVLANIIELAKNKIAEYDKEKEKEKELLSPIPATPTSPLVGVYVVDRRPVEKEKPK